jgi:hypothetical protein
VLTMLLIWNYETTLLVTQKDQTNSDRSIELMQYRFLDGTVMSTFPISNSIPDVEEESSLLFSGSSIVLKPRNIARG